MRIRHLNACDRSGPPLFWKCRHCLKLVCAKCEGTHSGVSLIDDACDLCWARISAAVGFALALLLARRRR